MARERLNLPDSLSSRKYAFLSKSITIDEFFDLFDKFYQLKSMEGLADRSLKNHALHMKYFEEFICHLHPTDTVCCFDIEVCRMYVNYMLDEKQLSNVTVNIRLRTLKTFLKWLYIEGYLDNDISTRIKLLKEPKDVIKPLSDKNVLKMLKAPDMTSYDGFRDYALMLLMLDCGVRVNEAVNIKVADVDLKSGLIVIRGKIAKARTARYLPKSLETAKYIKSLINVANKNRCEYVFQSVYGGKISSERISRNFTGYGKKMGVKERCTPHVFRHTFATNFVRAGGDVFTLQKILGHSTLATSRRYIQLNTDDLRKKHSKANLLNRYLK